MTTAQLSWDDVIDKAKTVFSERGLSEMYADRLDFELKEIDKQGANQRWINWFVDGKKFDSNPNMLLLPWLLGMVEKDPLIDRKEPILNTVRASRIKEFKQEHGYIPSDLKKDADMPDIDLDCLPEARDPIKEYAAEIYGLGINDGYGPVCSVGTWQTYKFKNAIIDACAGTGFVEKQEAFELTTSLPDDVDQLKDGGKSVCKGRVINSETGESKECGTKHALSRCPNCGSSDTEGPTLGKLLDEHEQLRVFSQRHKEVVQYAVQLVGRIRNMGMHAGALIIADRSLYGNIPMAKSSTKGYWVSMWTEGRNTQLSKFGFYKWDILGLKTLKYIFECCKLIEQNRGISFGQNMEGWDYNNPEKSIAGWYINGDGEKCFIDLNDPHALRLANEQKTDGVFQFDTDLAKSILANGVRNFDDLMLFNAMGHPGPMASIPEAVRNRDDKKGSWKKRLHPQILPILESTYGVICYHEDTLISLGTGDHISIRDMSERKRMGILDSTTVHSVKLDSNEIRTNEVTECLPTIRTDGIRITLENGYNVIITPTHKILCWAGYEKACDLKVGDLVATPKMLPQPLMSSDEFISISEWLGKPKDVAYLVGQLIGDGLTSSTSHAICAGSKENAEILADWISSNLDLICNIYFHCRSWYVGLSNQNKIEPHINLSEFKDNQEWWLHAYDSYSGSDIANFLGRSTWFVYNRLKLYCNVNGVRKRSAKTKWHKLIEDLGLDINLYNKRIPSSILTASANVKAACLAGLIDSDGTITSYEDGCDIVHITSESPLLLEDVRQLLLMFDISHRLTSNRIYIWSTENLADKISEYLLLKEFSTRLTSGHSVGYIPKEAFVRYVEENFESKRQFARDMKISRRIFSYKSDVVRSSTAIKAGMDLGDLRYYRVKSLETVENQQFYDLSVENDHNLIANGIVASNCYQEQLQAIWQNMADFTAPEAQDARKAVAKKWTHKLKPICEKWLDGASRTMSREEAVEWWSKMETFGRYAFNRSHAVSYCLVAHRCLWLKAHFAPEFWAAVMSDCHSDKLVRFMSTARSEKWVPTDITYSGKYVPEEKSDRLRFDTLNLSNLTKRFTVTGDVVNQGLIGIKGIGNTAAAKYEGRGEYTDIDDFIAQKGGKDKSAIERFIKLGSFRDLPGHENAKATWLWYQYKYCSGKNITKLRNEIKAKLLANDGWNEQTIQAKRDSMIATYRRDFPNRRKIPDKFNNWKPTPNDSRTKVMALCEDDFSLVELLDFEREYLGYLIHSPLDLYVCSGGCSIEEAKAAAEAGDECVLEVVVDDISFGTTRTGNEYARIIVTDGMQQALVLMWSNEMAIQDATNLVPGTGVQMHVDYDSKRNSFSLGRGEIIIRLIPKDHMHGKS